MYTLNILEDSGIVEAVTSGNLTATDMHTTRQKIAELCKTENLTKVLVDDRTITSLPSFEDLFQFGATFLESGFPLYIKIAHVVNSEMMADNEFLETVAVNRGANIKTFQNLDEAKAWLKD
jgi:hypothetical protein